MTANDTTPNTDKKLKWEPKETPSMDVTCDAALARTPEGETRTYYVTTLAGAFARGMLDDECLYNGDSRSEAVEICENHCADNSYDPV